MKNKTKASGKKRKEAIYKEKEILGYANHANRPDLGGEHPKGDLVQFIFMGLFFVIWGLDSFVFQLGPDLHTYVPLWIRMPLGSLLLLSSLYLATITLKIVFGKVRDPPVVIKEGPYNRSRHPMYFSTIVLYISFWIFTLSLLSLAMILPIFILYWWLAVDEERRLLDKFGEKYRQYQEETRMWI